MSIGFYQRFGLEQFQRQLLGEHVVATYEIAFRAKTPCPDAMALRVKLRNVHHAGAMDSVSFSSISANDIE